MNVKAYQLHEDENGWRDFIYDKDSCSDVMKKFFPDGVLPLEKFDPETVKEARDEGKTVVTSDEGYVRFALDAQSRSINPRCDDCWGLVIIPNGDYQRQRAFTKAKVRSGVKIGGERLTWKAAMWANLYVKITSDGKMTVRKFERCEFCQRDCPIDADWYRSLPSIG